MENTPMQVEATLKAIGPPLWRLQLIRTLQVVGLLLAFTGTADFMNLLQILSPEAASWMAISGTALRFGIEPIVMLIGDLLDDGVKNDSFKISMVMLPFLFLAFLILTSCQSLSIRSPYGNLDSTKGGMIYTPPAKPIFIPDHTSK